jgi:carbon storage regulator
MLVLTRKSTEEIRIGNDITVKVIAIRGGQVKLGIDAPRGIRVSRVERADRTTPPQKDVVKPNGVPNTLPTDESPTTKSES